MFRSATLVLMTALGVAACAEGPIAPAQSDAELRLLHATANLGALDVAIGGATVIHGVTFGNSSLVGVSGGLQHVVVRAGGTVVAELDYSLKTTEINNLVVAAGNAAFSPIVTPDTGAVNPARANLRMVNVVGPNSADPTLLDVRVKAPNANPDSVLTFGMDSKVASYGTLMYFDAGHFDFKFVPRGGGTTLAHVAFDMVVGETRAVVLERAADGTYSATVVTEQ